MNYWQILGIKKTADLANIKRAYAAKLKLTKPDEDPEGFKRLHAAYKQASRYAKANANSAPAPAAIETESFPTTQPCAGHVTPEQPEESAKQALPEDMPEPPHVEPLANRNEPDRIERAGESIEYPPLMQDERAVVEDIAEMPQAEVFHAPEREAPEHEEDIYRRELEEIARGDTEDNLAMLQAEWEEITRRVDEVTEHMATLNALPAWRFLDEHDALLDLQFKSELSLYIFHKIATRLQEAGNRAVLKREVFFFLNRLFFWSERRDLLEEDFGHEAVDAVMQAVPGIGSRGIKWFCLKKHKGEIVPAGYYKRILATMIDWALLGLVAMLLAEINIGLFSSSQRDGFVDFITGMLLYPVLAPLMEATALQGTPGKILLGIKVVNQKGHRLNIFHALWRSIMFAVTLAAIKITVWINFFLRGHQLLHDRMSMSMVIRR